MMEKVSNYRKKDAKNANKIIAQNAELTIQEQHRLLHEEAVRKAHEAALKAAGQDPHSKNTQSNTVTTSETVQSVHTEVVDNASGETIKEKLEVTKKVVDSNGEVREDHFVAEMDDEDPQLESSQEEQEEDDPKVAEEPAEKEVQKTIQKNEASSNAGSEDSGKQESPDDEEFQKRMDDFSESLGSLLTDAVNTQRRLRKEMDDEEQVNVGDNIKLEVGGRKLKEIEIDGVKILTADTVKEKPGKKSGKNSNIPPTKVMREHEVDGIKIMTTVDLENKGLGRKLEKSNEAMK